MTHTFKNIEREEREKVYIRPAPQYPQNSLNLPNADPDDFRLPQAPPTGYLLTLSPLPSSVPTPIRLRQALKLLLRAFNFRCLSIAEIPTHDAPAQRVTHSPTADGLTLVSSVSDARASTAPPAMANPVAGDSKRGATCST